MKTSTLSHRSTVMRSTSIEGYRKSKAKNQEKVMNDLPDEIRKNDLGWNTVTMGALSILSIAIFFGSLLTIVLLFGSKF